ncbi:hypothetical protein DH2020_048234 [Rehmannia glutinosa]|uniref:3-oxo-5-alpha-steroid 4-dehydrogenase C-terminal domain-containing protein n=1 Tax=Rehmannia glutinosa TaxID=99300 RepID=A0ABR0U6S4_REHGL
MNPGNCSRNVGPKLSSIGVGVWSDSLSISSESYTNPLSNSVVIPPFPTIDTHASTQKFPYTVPTDSFNPSSTNFIVDLQQKGFGEYITLKKGKSYGHANVSMNAFSTMVNQALPMVLVSLLRAVWIAGTLPIVIASIPSSKVDAFRELLLKLSRRGKVMESSSKFSLRKSHSSLNYTYGIWKSVFLLLLMEAQVLRRLFESIYVFKYSPSARMHIAGYLTGLIFYTAAPLSLCCTYFLDVFKFIANMFVEFVVKGKDRMQVIEFDLWGLVNPFIQLKWYVWIGAAFFFWGWIHQQRCHAILGSLRENDQKVNDYAIPHGDWFKYVSSPHYLAEIVANLAFAAAETQRWYLRKFDNYPRNRCAIIPFVY